MKTKPLTLLAFDPSLHATGWATFTDGNYTRSGVIKIPNKCIGMDAVIAMWATWEKKYGFPAADTIVSEIQEYRHTNERASINKLLLLNGVCFGFLAMGVANKKAAYTPQQWKGSTPKRIHNLRVQHALDLHHITDDNELDAIGLGIFHLTGKKL